MYEWDPPSGTRKAPPLGVQNEWHRLIRKGISNEVRLGDLITSHLALLPPDSDNHVNSRRHFTHFKRFIGREAIGCESAVSPRVGPV